MGSHDLRLAAPYLAPTRYVNYLEDDDEQEAAAVGIRPELSAAAGSEEASTIPDNFFRQNVNITPA